MGWLCLALCLTAAEYTPTEQTGWFPFVIPDLAGDATEGAALDLSFLSPEPAGAHGFLRPRGEDLVDERGAPLRLLGSNITDYHVMMDKAHAEPAARRLRQLGINFIRLHYYDFAKAPAGIFNDDLRTLNPEKLDQMDWLIHQLIRHGIWVDLNLKVMRPYPDPPPGHERTAKGLDILHEPYIKLQEEFARQLLDHVNPYTGRRYADEPGIAIIELNNENTCLSGWDRWAGLPEPFAGPLRQRWNDWLAARYSTTDKLLAAWGVAGLTGPELLRNAALAAGLRDWTYQRSGGEGTLELAAGPAGPSLRWRVTAAGQQSWHHQLMQNSVPVADGRRYTLQFTGRADPPGRLSIDLMLQQEPWGNVASTRCELTGEWTRRQVTFSVSNPTGAPVRLNLSCDNRPGLYELADFSLREGALPPLQPGQTLETRTVPLVGEASLAGRSRDWVTFLLDAEMGYVKRLTRLLTDELGARQIIYCTQLSYGGGAGLIRSAELDPVADMHAYPDHPRTSEEGRPVRNISLHGAGAGAVADLAGRRLAGRPFLVTEFDVNPPNDFGAQVFLVPAVLAAYQGWAGFLDYVWYNFNAGPGTDSIKSNWATVGHSGQMAFVPAAALLFRTGLLQPARQRALLTVPRETALGATAREPGGWSWPGWSSVGVDRFAAWTTGLAVDLAPGDGPPTLTGVAPGGSRERLVSDTGEIVFDRTGEGAEWLAVNAPGCRLVTGQVEGREVPLGDVTMRFGRPLHRGFGQAALVTLDGRPLATCGRALLTVAGRVESAGMAYNAERTRARWGGAPTMAEPVPLTVELPPGSWRVSPLDGGGRAKTTRTITGRLTTEPGDATLWYLLER